MTALLLCGCSATGPAFVRAEHGVSAQGRIVVYRINQIGGKSGSWVPAHVELDDKDVGRLPSNAYLLLDAPPNVFTLAVTDMVNLRYTAEHRLTLRDSVATGDVVYFRVMGVYSGVGCRVLGEPDNGKPIAQAHYKSLPGALHTTCFQQVPETIALKELQGLRRAD